MLKLTKILSLILVVGLISCTLAKKTVYIQNINETKDVHPFFVVYNLPKITLEFQIRVAKVTYKKGPYAAYAQKYLGDNVKPIVENYSEWILSEAKIVPHYVVDSNHCYILSSDRELNFSVEYSINNFVKSFNDKDNLKKTNSVILKEFEQTKQLKINQVPYITQKKNIEEQAKEISDKLYTLYEDLYFLTTSQPDKAIPDGEALKVMITELKNTINYYLSLFLGQTDTTYFEYSFWYEPDEKKQFVSVPLFVFSKQEGVKSLNVAKGDIVAVNIDPLDNSLYTGFRSYSDFAHVYIQKKKLSYLPYRIPQRTLISLTFNNKVIAEKLLYVPQFGFIGYIPLNDIINKKISIQLDSTTGAILKLETFNK